MRLKPKHFLLFLLMLFISIFVIDLIRITSYKTITKRGDGIKSEQDQVYYELVNGSDSIDWNRLDGTLEYISNEFDCADFRLVNLIRILYEFGDQVPSDYLSKIEKVLFNFRYWWDEPGQNSMCYWSENHQILFASAEYLIGNKYKDSIFPNSGLTGSQHMEKAKRRALDWMKMRWKYGFTEFYSEVYYKEDIAALINLIDFSDDEELVKKAQIIMDLLFYDVASQNIDTKFVSTTGRAYENSRKGIYSHLGGLTNHYWGDGGKIGAGMLFGMMVTNNYQLPTVIAEIGKDTSEVIIKQSNGLDIMELKDEGYFGTDTRSMMMQWGMEAFTNPEIVRNSMTQVRRSHMFSNAFLGDFKLLDFTLVKWLHLEPLIMEILNPQSNGVAIQRANTYTYKTADYSMYTTQAYHPGTYGDQHHVFGVTFGDHFAVYHSHPALEKGQKKQSPNYWVGYGHLPHSVQDQNINLSIYNLPESKGIMEMDLLDYTYAYFPKSKFDSAFIDGKYAFGKKDDAYCAFIGASNFEFRDESEDDIIQKGKQVFWITELSSKSEEGSFREFVDTIKGNKVEFHPGDLSLTYQSNERQFHLTYRQPFKVDGEVIPVNYKRYDSPYVKAERGDSTIVFKFNNKSHLLDFYKMNRISF